MLINMRNGLMAGGRKNSATFRYFGLYIVSDYGGRNANYVELGRCYLGDLDLSDSVFIGYGGHPTPEYDRDRSGYWVYGDSRQTPRELVTGDGRPYGFGIQNYRYGGNTVFYGPYFCPFRLTTPVSLGTTYVQQGGRWGDSATTSRRITDMSLFLSNDAITWFSAYHYQGTPAAVNFTTFISTTLDSITPVDVDVSRFIKTT